MSRPGARRGRVGRSTGRGTLIYDGECGFCTRAATWIARRWAPEQGHRAIAAQRWDAAASGGKPLTAEELSRAAWWLQNGRRDEGARAVARALMGAGGAWGALGRALLVPPVSIAARWTYRLVVRYRSYLPGDPAESVP